MHYWRNQCQPEQNQCQPEQNPCQPEQNQCQTGQNQCQSMFRKYMQYNSKHCFSDRSL